MDSCDVLNDRTRESYAEREKQWFDRFYFHVRNLGFTTIVVPNVRKILTEYDLLFTNDTCHILDVGCKYGNKTDAIVRATVADCVRKVDFLGIDLHLPKKEIVPNDSRIHFSRNQTALEEMPEDNFERFDVISAMAVTHHFPDLEVAIKKIRDLLSKDGIVFMVDSYCQHQSRLHELYVQGYETLECNGHFNRATAEQVRECMEDNGLRMFTQFPCLPKLDVMIARHKRSR